MASSGPQKWAKYFNTKSGVPTFIKAKPNELVRIFDLAKKPIMSVKDAEPIIVLPMPKFNSNYMIEIKKNGKKVVGYVNEKYVAKPIARKPGQGNLSRVTALHFAKHGTSNSFNYAGQKISVLSFTDPKKLEQSILAGLKDIEKNKGAAHKAFEAFFKSGYNKLTWNSETHENDISKYGVYIGELLTGLFYLSGKASKAFNTVPINKKAAAFHIPNDPSFSGIDSIVEFRENQYLPLSSKFGVGAAASIFSNIMTKGIIQYKTYKPSVFKDLCACAMSIGVTKQDLESKRKSKEIVYEYGIRNILGIKKGNNKGQVFNTMEVYQDLKANKKTPGVITVLTAIMDKCRDEQILKKLPKSITAFFTREIARLLNACKESMKQIHAILLGKKYWQASLDTNKWKKGEVEFKMTRSGNSSVNIIGNKSAMDDLDAKQGTINYILKST